MGGRIQVCWRGIMRLGLKRQLIIAFIICIITPVIVTGGLIKTVIDYVNTEPEFEHLARVDRFFEDMTAILQDNHHLLSQDNQVRHLMQDYFDRFDSDLIIISRDDRILFDSNNSNAYEQNIKGYFDIRYGADLSLRTGNSSDVRYIKPIIVDRQLLANAIFIFDEQEVMSLGFQRVFILIGLSVLSGILLFIILMSFFTIFISKSVLIPLGELSEATKKVAMGELDFDLEYRNQNEIGSFVKAFNTMKEQLKASINKQKEQDDAKKHLIASISHDLRTPMTSIKGYVEALKDGKAKDPQAFERYLSVIQNKTESLDRLIDDLTLFSKLETGQMQMKFMKMDFKDYLEEYAAIKECEALVDACNIRFKRPFPSVIVTLDRERMNQVMDNIIGNALKFSSNSCEIMIKAQIYNDFVRVSISDKGPGIHEDDLPYVFQRFYRGDKSRSREHGGTGLGLAICQTVVEAHQGEIWAESVIDQGTTVYFQLPLSSAD